MLLSAVSVLVVVQSSSEIPEGLMNNPVFCSCLRSTRLQFALNVRRVPRVKSIEGSNTANGIRIRLRAHYPNLVLSSRIESDLVQSQAQNHVFSIVFLCTWQTVPAGKRLNEWNWGRTFAVTKWVLFASTRPDSVSVLAAYSEFLALWEGRILANR